MAESKDLQAPSIAPVTTAAGAARDRLRRGWRHWAMLPIRYEAQQSAPLPSDRICFVLETDRLLDRLILQDLCVRNAWPEPDGVGAGLWSVRTIKGFLWRRRLVPRDVAQLQAVIARDRALGGQEGIALVPVAIFWGRAPQRENSLLEVLASEDWGLAGRLRRFIAVLVHGRTVLVKVGDPFRVAS